VRLTLPSWPRCVRSRARPLPERYGKGETMAMLAREYGVSEPTMWRALSGPR
jgi:hypothetical protein